jgi:multiple sugar transport system permease protein
MVMRSPFKWVLLGPALLLVLATTIYPLIYAGITSFRDWRLTRSPGPEGFVGLENYTRAFGDTAFLNSLRVTLLFVAVSVTLSVVIGLLIALQLQRRSLVNTVIKTLLIFPFATAPAVKGYLWRFMLAPEGGIYSTMIGNLVPPLKGFVWLGNEYTALFMIAMSEIWGWAPLIALMFLGALGSISPEIFEAGRVDGANEWQVMWRITLPLLSPVMFVIILLRIIASLKMFDQVVTMTGGGPGRATQTLNFYVYNVAFRNLDIGYASALAYILVMALSVFAYMYVRTLMRREV